MLVYMVAKSVTNDLIDATVFLASGRVKADFVGEVSIFNLLY